MPQTEYPFDPASCQAEPTRWEGNRHIVRYGNGPWGFWDETQTQWMGDYDDPCLARAAFFRYCHWLEHGEEAPVEENTRP